MLDSVDVLAELRRTEQDGFGQGCDDMAVIGGEKVAAQSAGIRFRKFYEFVDNFRSLGIRNCCGASLWKARLRSFSVSTRGKGGVNCRRSAV